VVAVRRFVFGPVRSRRLGRSLGVNNVPYKTCSYSCVYCQLGRTTDLTVERRGFYDWREVAREVIEFVSRYGDGVDYVTFAPDGEPTLNANLGRVIEEVKREVNPRVAVLTNASLLWLSDVREDLALADLISVKVDAVDEGTWRRVNRPHPELRLGRVLEGILEFSKSYGGVLVSETMLVHNVNTGAELYRGVAEYLREVNPRRVYLSVPTRPPAEDFVRPPPPGEVVEAYEEFSKALDPGRVELLNMPEPPPTAVYGDPATWLLNTVSVHPLMVEHAVYALRGVVQDPERLIEELVERGLIAKTRYQGRDYIVRNFRLPT
jgi:wyosine [tRNA(Phe)-imidazoG37] synthetase (radical SAM superfamily)